MSAIVVRSAASLNRIARAWNWLNARLPAEEVLGDKLVFALSDNDGAGRKLWEDGHLHKGGKWRQQTNGVTWCLLVPSPEFKAAMERASVPPAHWPCVMENVFSGKVRRQAATEGAYALKDEFFADLTTCTEFTRGLLTLQKDARPDDELWLYLKAPTVEAKDAFTAWITAPERRTEEVYAGFSEIIKDLRALLERRAGGQGADPRQARLI
jgi:hypothetical protein